MVRTIRRGYVGVFAVLAAMTLLCVLAGTSAAATGDTTRVSVADGSGAEASSGGGGTERSMSADGRYVAFNSKASDLVDGDTNDAWDVFVRDRQTEPPQSRDCTAPTTTPKPLLLPHANGWNNSNVTVTLDATDNDGGSGVRVLAVLLSLSH